MTEPKTRPGAGEPSRIVELDGWRGISIAFVIIGHLLNHRYGSVPGVRSPDLAEVLSVWGVDIFFVISGFIITRLALKEREQSGAFSISGFYTRRFFRIVPPFYACLAATGCVAAVGLIDQPLPGIAAAAGFTCNLSHVPCGWFAGHSWSLAFEEQFYLSLPLIFRFSGRNIKKILAGLLVLLMLFPFFRYLANLQGLWHSAAGLVGGFSFICIGAVAAVYERTFAKIATSRVAPHVSIAVLVGLSALAALNSAFSFPPASRAAYLQASVNSLLLPPFLAWVILLPVYRRSPINRLLGTKCLQFLGAVSYSLYLWQQIFTAQRGLYLMDSFLTFPPLMLAAAIASYYGIEKPCIRIGRMLPTNMRVVLRRRQTPGSTADRQNVYSEKICSEDGGVGAPGRVRLVEP